MDIKSPKAFETSDKAHADLFNDMVKVLLENDTGLLDQLGVHIDDTKLHASAAEKKKWNESQLYKITADDGKYLISVPADKNIFDAIKDKGTCTFIASPGVEDSPAPSNAYLRGIQTVGQNNIGTGFAVDTSGNAYYFYYNSTHISITWTQLPTVAERNKWNNGQLSKITEDNGIPLIYVRDTSESILDKIIDKGLGMGTFYAVSNSKDLPEAARAIRGTYHITDTTNGKGSFGWVYATDFANVTYHNYLNNGSWRGWKRIITDVDSNLDWKFPTIRNGWKTYKSEVNNDYRVRVGKDAMGNVTVKGAIAGGTLGDVPAFTLPKGCEPDSPFYNLGVASSTGGFKGPQYSRQYIATDGRFIIQDSSSNNEFIVVNCMFKAKE
ncbi:MAG: hypothetical protein ACQEWR_12890 [Bacillota bacterium]